MGKLKGLISNHNETSDNHKDEQLRSHYYKTSQAKAIEAVKEVIAQMDGYQIGNIQEDRGEISVKGKKAFMVITIITVRPFEISIDFSVTSESVLPMDFGYSRKVILSMYEKLDKVLPYVGTAGNKKR